MFVIHDIDACGGMERQAGLLAARLGRRGHEVLVLSGFDCEPSLGALRLRPLEPRPGYQVQRVAKLRGVPAEVADEVGLLLSAVAVWRWGGADALYGLHVASGCRSQDLSRLCGAPWAIKLAGGGAPGDVGTATRLELEALRDADRVVCLTRQLEDEARGAGVASARLARIPNGVDLAAVGAAPPLAPAALGLEQDDEALLFVGRLDQGKRVDLLLRALARLLPARPRARLLIAGAGPSESDLRRSCEAQGLARVVRFLGQRGDVPSLLGLARAVVLPSASEGMSNVILEALAAGTPVVASRIPANEEVIDERSAWLFPLGDAQALTDALAAALSDPAEARRRALLARERAVERFDIEHVAAAYEQLLRELRARPSGWRARLGLLRARTVRTRVWSRERGAAWVDERRRLVSEGVVALKAELGRAISRRRWI